jgi:hypothetical protein
MSRVIQETMIRSFTNLLLLSNLLPLVGGLESVDEGDLLRLLLLVVGLPHDALEVLLSLLFRPLQLPLRRQPPNVKQAAFRLPDLFDLKVLQKQKKKKGKKHK